MHRQLRTTRDSRLDLDADGFGDFIAGAPRYRVAGLTTGTFTSEGAILAYSGLVVASSSTIGQGCGPIAVRPVLSVTLPRFGAQVFASVTNTVPVTPGGLVITGVPAQPSPIFLGGCSIAIDPVALATVAPMPLLTDAAGAAVLVLGTLPPPAAALANLPFRLQAYVLAPGGIVVSNGVEARIGG